MANGVIGQNEQIPLWKSRQTQGLSFNISAQSRATLQASNFNIWEQSKTIAQGSNLGWTERSNLGTWEQSKSSEQNPPSKSVNYIYIYVCENMIHIQYMSQSQKPILVILWSWCHNQDSQARVESLSGAQHESSWSPVVTCSAQIS